MAIKSSFFFFRRGLKSRRCEPTSFRALATEVKFEPTCQCPPGLVALKCETCTVGLAEVSLMPLESLPNCHVSFPLGLEPRVCFFSDSVLLNKTPEQGGDQIQIQFPPIHQLRATRDPSYKPNRSYHQAGAQNLLDRCVHLEKKNIFFAFRSYIRSPCIVTQNNRSKKFRDE